MALAFSVPFVLADQLGVQRDAYYAIYVAAVVALFVGWAHDARQSLPEMLARRRRLAAGLGVIFAIISVFIATAAEGGRAAPRRHRTTGDQVTKLEWWHDHAAHVQRRNAVVHQGFDLPRSDARASLDAAGRCMDWLRELWATG